MRAPLESSAKLKQLLFETMLKLIYDVWNLHIKKYDLSDKRITKSPMNRRSSNNENLNNRIKIYKNCALLQSTFLR